MILKATASQDLYIWHSFFGIPLSNNDINILHKSPLFDDVIHRRAPSVKFTVNGNEYNQWYYLADGIDLDKHLLINKYYFYSNFSIYYNILYKEGHI